MENKYSTHFIDANKIVEAYFECNNYNPDKISDEFIENFIEIFLKDDNDNNKYILDYIIDENFPAVEKTKLIIN